MFYIITNVGELYNTVDGITNNGSFHDNQNQQ